ncbi:hypothetical protein CWI82_09460 [Pseudidiomarina tainanensis]|jgi:hypothetical protein|uniref:Uncharacterized protein n=1 Tax=Pseudidiomarina tainanensis TaxID=502365 RepID=A0ACD2HG97_9GAMM|nr:hypothetical protein [Pseudidiomarina tainanensis]RZQ55596.1 hypothetical protein CWI82_09460 [Pseudidiomarina tainanensis]
MSSGVHNKLIGQIGENLVAAKLGTLGYYASPYAGNVPGFDLTAVDSKTLSSFPVQVKCSTGNTLVHSQIDRWIETHIDSTGKYSFGNPVSIDHPDMLWIMVNLPKGQIENARYFICRESDIQKLVIERFRAFIQKHNHRRPNGGASKQAILTLKELGIYENNWSAIAPENNEALNNDRREANAT